MFGVLKIFYKNENIFNRVIKIYRTNNLASLKISFEYVVFKCLRYGNHRIRFEKLTHKSITNGSSGTYFFYESRIQ